MVAFFRGMLCVMYWNSVEFRYTSQCGYRCVYTVACQVKHKLTPGSCVVLELAN